MADEDISDLYEAARKVMLKKVTSTGSGEGARNYAEAYVLLTNNPPNKGRSAYED